MKKINSMFILLVRCALIEEVVDVFCGSLFITILTTECEVVAILVDDIEGYIAVFYLDYGCIYSTNPDIYVNIYFQQVVGS